LGNVGGITTEIFSVPWIDQPISVNPVTLKITWIIMGIILVVAVILRLGIKRFPGKAFMAFELIYGGFEGMANEALGKKDARKITPLVFTLFIFVLLCNWAGIIPGVESPTRDLNTCLGLGLMVFIISHILAIAHKGFFKYLSDYTKPFIIFLPLNIVGEFGKVISHSFRLFGNIYAGGIILALAGPVTLEVFGVLKLPAYSASPLLLFTYMILHGFFGLFVGTVQALVFSLLALTYISVLRES